MAPSDPSPLPRPSRFRVVPLLLATLSLGSAPTFAASVPSPAKSFRQDIAPLLEKYCYECHGEGMSKGNVVFDEFKKDADIFAHPDVWFKALRNVRAGLMPPPDKDVPRPDQAEIAQLANWIKFGAFGIDPANPDPGRVTARRLNRIEYRNTIRDLMGIDFNSEAEFPPDDSGGGFDNNGDILTLSPLLLEKYLSAAEIIAERAVPKVPRVMQDRIATGRDFPREDGTGNGELLTAKEPARVAHTFNVDRAETYRLAMELEIRGTFDFDPAHCHVICRVDGAEMFTEDVVWRDRRQFLFERDVAWAAGPHTVTFEIEPVAPVAAKDATPAELVNAVVTPPAPGRGGQPGPASKPVTRLDVRIVSVNARGPVKPEFWVPPENYRRFFPGDTPTNARERDRYAADVLRAFATRAFRRPVEEAQVKRLVAIARAGYTKPGVGFEEAMSRAFMAVIASPRFIFRIEEPDAREARQPFAAIDDYALASRLSYFLWSSMPDDELFQLAAKGELRSQLAAQVTRMLGDPKGQAFSRNFTGQWLQARDVEFVPINMRAILGADAPRNAQGRQEFDGPTRKAMRSETEMYFEYVVRENRSVLELVDSDYTFLNAQLAKVYDLPEVKGDELRRVTLPGNSQRGGVLTQGTVLAVTSNPTRTSPVKRGLFVLENFLGTPPPAPPPDIPALEEAKKEFAGREPKLSEMLAVHRNNKMCQSCHARMDPLGLAFENFNPMGMWRDTDAKQPIDAAGKLITGEAFADVRQLKHLLANERRMDYYRCLTEKLLTYALGRGLEPYDVFTVDQIVDRLVREDGRMSALIMGVIESTPFQRQRTRNFTARSAATSVAQLETKP